MSDVDVPITNLIPPVSHINIEDDNRPLPLAPLIAGETEESRLWIGNLDSRITEYHLVKVLQKYGKVTKFDFLFHKAGPLQGQPKGYCFVTFESRDQAAIAVKELDGKLALSKRLNVKWAYLHPKTEEDGVRHSESLSSSTSTKSQDRSDDSISAKIRAIEAKLKAMEENKDVDYTERPEIPIVFNSQRAPLPPPRPRHRRRPYYRPAPSRSRRR